MNTAIAPSGLDLGRLQAELAGRVLTSIDPDYESARIVTRGDIDKHPAAIVEVSNTDDIVRAIRFARDNNMELAVRSGGHSSAGHSTTAGGLVIDVRHMNRVEMDTAAKTLWAEAGATGLEVSAAAWEKHLVIGFGDTGSVGVSGLTLGGGIGYLVRKYGLAIDNLIAAEIVTAESQVLTIDANSHPDLFWAIRGGGGNFGVVSRLKFQLQDLLKWYGGLLILPGTAETVEGFIAAAQAAPEELSAIANVMNCPPMPFLPEETVGQIVILAMAGFAGDAEAGETALAPFRALAKPLADMVSDAPYTGMYPPEDPSYRPLAHDHVMFMDRFDGQDAAAIIDQLKASDAALRAVQLRVLGGAMARVPSSCARRVRSGSEKPIRAPLTTDSRRSRSATTPTTSSSSTRMSRQRPEFSRGEPD